MNKNLDDIKKKPSFQVPDGYFEDLPLRIQKRIEAEKPRSKSIHLPSWSYATAAAIILITSFFVFFNTNQNPVDDFLADISEEDLVAYIENLDLDEYDLAVTFPDATSDLEFEDVEMMDGLELEDQSIDDILLEYDIELEEIVI